MSENQVSSERVHFECADPVLRVEDMGASLTFYVDLLGFKNAGMPIGATTTSLPFRATEPESISAAEARAAAALGSGSA